MCRLAVVSGILEKYINCSVQLELHERGAWPLEDLGGVTLRTVLCWSQVTSTTRYDFSHTQKKKYARGGIIGSRQNVNIQTEL